MIQITTQAFRLDFKRPFRISHGTRSHTDVVFVCFGYNGLYGYGEASLPPYLDESTDSVLAFFKNLRLPLPPLRENLPELSRIIDEHIPSANAARAAASMAITDLTAKTARVSMAALLGLPNQPAKTSYTITRTDEKELESELSSTIPAEYIKVKLTGDDDPGFIEKIRSLTDLPGWVDVNQGWHDHTYALEMAAMLKEKDFLFLEQPFPAERDDLSEWLKVRSPLPVFADESCRTPKDFDRVSDCFDGLNIKLMKAGGMFPAIRLSELARDKNMHILLGGMAESSCAAAAALAISSLADFVDLDGPLLISNDPFSGISYRDGLMQVRDIPGTGVETPLFS